MRIYDLFSKQQKRQRGEMPDVYQYQIIPIELRVQIVNIIKDNIKKMEYIHNFSKVDVYNKINKLISNEYGLFTLATKEYETNEVGIINYILQQEDIERVLDIIQVFFRYFDDFKKNISHKGIIYFLDVAVVELNDRFKEHGFGFQYESRQIIRVDSTYLHSEMVKPVLYLLKNTKFEGANDEFLNAHEHYRRGRNKECLNDCLKAFESTMKIIIIEKGWDCKKNIDTSNKLIDICFDNELMPNYMKSQFTSLKSLIASGIPTVRNKNSGHGQGQTSIKVSDELARYALNITGTNLFFLIEQSKL